MRDMPDFIDISDNQVYRLLVCNGRDEPFIMRESTVYVKDSATAHASFAVYYDLAATRCDDVGLYWYTYVDVIRARDLARKTVGR